MKTNDRNRTNTSGNFREKKRRSTFTVLFYINRTKIRRDGTCQLLCRVSIDAQAAQIGTGITIDPSLWNPQTERMEGRGATVRSANREIERLSVRIGHYYQSLLRDLGFVTAELVKNAVEGIAMKPLTLLALFREHNEESRRRVGVDRTIETYKCYETSYNHLATFVRQKWQQQDVTLRSLDSVFYDDFELFLRTECGMMPKTVHDHLYRLKKITKRAVDQGTLRRDPYREQHPALPRSQSRHLGLSDLKKLMETPVDRPNLQRVQDWFLFATFTGLAYADLKRLSEKDITQAADGTQWIHIRRKKSDVPSAIRLLEVPRRIIEKYRPERKGEKIFNLYSRNYLIKLTRELGRIYGFDMTFHQARHNFGTHITLSLGVPIETVSRMMGHTKTSTTQIYARVTDRKIAEDMKRLKRCTQGAVPSDL